MYLNGLMLISIALDFATIAFHDGNDVPYPMFLPTYAAIAHYHGKHGDRALADVLAEAEAYAANEYPVVLAKGSRLSTEERAAAVATIAALAGVSEDYVDRVNLRMEHVRFYTELLRDRRLVVGGWTAGSPAGTTTTAASGSPTTRRTRRSWARTPPR